MATSVSALRRANSLMPLVQASIPDALHSWVPNGRARRPVVPPREAGTTQAMARRRGRRRQPIRDPFVRWLDEDRQARRLNHRQFAALISVSAQHWSNVRLGTRAFGTLQIQVICNRIAGASEAYRSLVLPYHPDRTGT